MVRSQNNWPWILRMRHAIWWMEFIFQMPQIRHQNKIYHIFLQDKKIIDLRLGYLLISQMKANDFRMFLLFCLYGWTFLCYTCDKFQKGIRKSFLSFQGGLSKMYRIYKKILIQMREIWNFGKKWYVLEEILRHISGSLSLGFTCMFVC